MFHIVIMKTFIVAFVFYSGTLCNNMWCDCYHVYLIISVLLMIYDWHVIEPDYLWAGLHCSLHLYCIITVTCRIGCWSIVCYVWPIYIATWLNAIYVYIAYTYTTICCSFWLCVLPFLQS